MKASALSRREALAHLGRSTSALAAWTLCSNSTSMALDQVNYLAVPDPASRIPESVSYPADSYRVANRPIAESRVIRIWIGKRPPAGVSKKEWRSAVRSVCRQWFSRAGCTVKVMKDFQSAEIVFRVRMLAGVMGESRTPPGTRFPYLPRVNGKARIFINRFVLSLGHRNLTRTLRHEVGHAIGLRHDRRSVVGYRHANLTAFDYRRIEQFRRYLDRRWPVDA